MIYQSVYENSLYKQKTGTAKVITYHSARKVDIEFLNTHTKLTVTAQQLKKGTVEDKMYPKILGVGYHGYGKHLRSKKGKLTKCYSIWYDMLNRCYNTKLHTSKHSSYKNTTVDKEWHNFQNFAEWFEKNYIEGWNLDKDLKGSNIYSPKTCLYVPYEVNMAEAHLRKAKEKNPNFEAIYKAYVDKAISEYTKKE